MVEIWSFVPVLAGPAVGSFLGVVISRYPHASVLIPARSHCDACGTVLTGRDLVPLASWAALGGRCRHCRAPISLLNPLIELIATILALAAVLVLPYPLSWFACLLGWTLLALAVIDIRHLEVPDFLSLPLIPAGLAAAWTVDPELAPVHAAAAVAGGGLIWLIGALYHRWRGRAGIGDGDIRLFAVAGAWVGPAGLPAVLLLAGLFGLVAAAVLAGLRARYPQDRIPFVPALGAAIWLVFLSPDVLFLLPDWFSP
jgi:leader peptidase (prepilin peptidase)/N-methyltransferase